MENILYYPGCTVKRNAREYEESTRAVLNQIGVNMVELNKWYCCGALYGLAIDNLMSHVGAVRTLIHAEEMSRQLGVNKLLTICPMCYNVLKRVNKFLRENPDKYNMLTQYFIDEGRRYSLNIEVVHLVELLRDNLYKIKEKMVRDPHGFKAVISVYYGCTIVRPRDIGVDDPEDPLIIENMLSNLGFKTVSIPFKTYCCGSYHILDNPEIVFKNTSRIIESSINHGSPLMVTVCPLCLHNVRETVKRLNYGSRINAVYLPEIIAYMMGLDNYVSKESLEVLNKFFV